MTLHIQDWKEWQGVAIREKNRGRRKDRRIRRRLSWVSVATQFPDDRGNPRGSFWEFAEEVGGRSAETFWVRVLQEVGLDDPLYGRLVGRTNGRDIARMVGRGYDRVTDQVGDRVLAALVKSRLVTESCSKTCRKACGKNRAPEVEVDLDVDSKSKTDVDVASLADRHGESAAVASPEPPATAEARTQEEPPCSCVDGLLPDGSFCSSCQGGKDRRRAWKRVRDAERESASRATAAGSRPASEPTRATFHLPPRAAS